MSRIPASSAVAGEMGISRQLLPSGRVRVRIRRRPNAAARVQFHHGLQSGDLSHPPLPTVLFSGGHRGYPVIGKISTAESRKSPGAAPTVGIVPIHPASDFGGAARKYRR